MLSALQAGFRQREPRVKVVVPCRMNHGGKWADACIHNISSRGMMVAADGSVKTGDYIDIRRGTLIIIGRVMWRKDRFFGVRTQDRISVQTIVGEPRRAAAGAAPDPAGQGDRRLSSRLVQEARAACNVERSRVISSAIQYGFLACGAVAAALFVATQVHEMLASPLHAVETALGNAAH